MFYDLAIKYLIRYLRKKNLNNIEIVIRSDDYTYYKRDKEKEESVNKTLSMIK